MDSHKKVALIEYASPGLVPPELLAVGFVTGTVTPDCQLVTPNWVASKAAAPVEQVCWGAVKYASVNLVPARLKKIGAG